MTLQNQFGQLKTTIVSQGAKIRSLEAQVQEATYSSTHYQAIQQSVEELKQENEEQRNLVSALYHGTALTRLRAILVDEKTRVRDMIRQAQSATNTVARKKIQDYFRDHLSTQSYQLLGRGESSKQNWGQYVKVVEEEVEAWGVLISELNSTVHEPDILEHLYLIFHDDIWRHRIVPEIRWVLIEQLQRYFGLPWSFGKLYPF